MKRKRLTNKFLKNKSDYSEENYFKQQNYCESLFRKTKKNCCGNLNPEARITELFGEQLNPSFH